VNSLEFQDFLDILKNVFDVLSLAGILFFIYRFAVKRKALKLVLGVVLFLVATVLVNAAELTALSFVFGDFRQLGVIAILIIFQPELRSALEKIGGTTFESIQNINHNGVDLTAEGENIQSIAKAAQQLANMNFGALIVIEREDSLDEYKGEGVYLDSAITVDGIKSIFYKGATLHDGAAIIREGRIEYARCILPMLQEVKTSGDLGTRHRAALSTTLKSDAIVIVVSEESKIISLSVDGKLERNFNQETLSIRLAELLAPSRKDSLIEGFRNAAKAEKQGRKNKDKKNKNKNKNSKNTNSQSGIND
jgi:diadenylate cyclase